MAETISSQYTTREMLEALKLAPPMTTFLQDRLVKRTLTHATRYLEIDVETSGQTKAAYVSLTGPSEVIAKNGYSSQIHFMPYTRQSMVVTWEDLETRLPGMTVYDSGTIQGRRDMLVGGWLGELRKRIVRLMEYQLAEGLISGKTAVSGNGVSYTIDYQRAAGNSKTLTTTARWNQSATRDIPGDIKTACTQMSKGSIMGGDPDLLILGYGAGANFMAEATTSGTVLNLSLNMLKLDRGMIDLQLFREQKVQYLGNYRDIGVDLDIVVYKGTYTDSSGVEQYYVGENDAIFVNSNLRVDRHYGVITNLNGPFVGEMFPSSWVENNGSAEYLQLESSPLVAVHQPNSTYYLKTV